MSGRSSARARQFDRCMEMLDDQVHAAALAAEAPGAPGALVLIDRSEQVAAITPDAPDLEISGEHRDTAAHARGYAAGQFAEVDFDTRRRLDNGT